MMNYQVVREILLRTHLVAIHSNEMSKEALMYFNVYTNAYT